MEMLAMQSESIEKVAPALFEAMGSIDTAKKTQENPYHKSSYADLQAVHEACSNPLRKSGLLVLQRTVPTDKPQHLAIYTQIIHVKSCEFLAATMEIPLGKSDPQAFGSALTYGRRYSLLAMLNIVTADDDGNGAMGFDQQSQQQPIQPVQQGRGRQQAPPSNQRQDIPPQGGQQGQPRMNTNGQRQSEVPQGLSGVEFVKKPDRNGVLYWFASGSKTREHYQALCEYGFTQNKENGVWWKLASNEKAA